MDMINALRAQTARFLIIFLGINLPIVIAVDWLVQGAPGYPSIIAGAVTVSVLAVGRLGGAATARYFLSVGLMLMVGSLLAAMAGHPWQTDIHMYFFATLAMLTAFCDWRAILLGTATVALHHLILNFLLPMAIFPGGADFFRVVIHAVIVLVEAGVLIWLSQKLVAAFSRSEEAVAVANQAKEETQRLAEVESRREAELAQERQQMQTRLAGEFEAKVGNLVRQLEGEADHLRSLAGSMSGAASDNAAGAEGARSAVETASGGAQRIASAADGLSGSVNEIMGQVARSGEITAVAVQEAARTSASVAELSEAAQRIGDVVQLINDIAGQTNLLALNATIEAARAGEAGKGFAVVASEVKNLANQTAKATEDITGQVTAIQTATHNSVEAMRGIEGTIVRINEIANQVTEAIRRQGSATQEIAGNARSVSEGAGHALTLTGQLAGSASSAKSTAQELLGAVDSLSQQTHHMNEEVKRFVTSLRVA
jgi:methyl-accepting chemotaxis protein